VCARVRSGHLLSDPQPEAEGLEVSSARLLEQIAAGAKICAEVERQLAKHPAPGLETLIKLHRAKVLKLSLEAEAAPDLFKLVCALMRPVMEWARLEEKRKERELAEQKYRDQKAVLEKEQGGDALKPQTLARIERELKLM
jgi:hypothetical protein